MVYNHSTLTHVTKLDKHLMVEVTKIIKALFDHNHSITSDRRLNFDCHSICRAISLYLPALVTIDGSYAGYKHITRKGVLRMRPCYSRHSWLLTPDRAVIDPHPVGVITLAPLLAIGQGKDAPFGSGLYIPDMRIHKSVSTREMRKKAEPCSASSKRSLRDYSISITGRPACLVFYLS